MLGVADIYTSTMQTDIKTAIWMNMMMTAFRRRFGLSRSAFVPLAIKYNIFTFLIEQYELLHYYDNDAVVDDVAKFIKEQGGNLHELS